MSSTAVAIELETYSHTGGVKPSLAAHTSQSSQPARRASRSSAQSNRLEDNAVQHAATEQLQQWNKPGINAFRLTAACWGFIIMGANDAAVGALIPYLEKYYHLSYTIVSLVFLSPILGYGAASLLNDRIHNTFGQRGIATLSVICHFIAYTVASVHPPYPLLVVIFIIAGFGNGLIDAAWNAWVGDMAHTNEILGILHAFYGLGATIAPLIATSLVTKAQLPWYTYYYIMIGFSGLELALSVPAFWSATGKQFRENHPRQDNSRNAPIREAMFTMPAARTTWIVTVFLFVYVGLEVALGGWIVTFMITVRHSSPFASGMAATGFWLGMTLGRVILGFVTPRLGEKRAVAAYILLTMALELLFWLVPQFYVSAVAVGLEGFFIGPLFPAAVLAATRILPKHLHVFAIGFAAASGGAGASMFPFMVGAIAQSSSKGVEVLQPMVLACLACLFILWLGLPKIDKKMD